MMTQIDEARPATFEAGAPGAPVWFELTTPDPSAATAFYGPLLGWEIAASGMEAAPDYLIARAGEDMVAGLMAPAAADQPTGWAIYVAVENCNAAVEAAKTAGGAVFYGPEQMPGVGAFAMIGDPGGAALGVMQVEAGSAPSRAWDQAAHGHGSWLELHAAAAPTALRFYGDLLGWAAGETMTDKGGQTYQMFTHQGATIGGIAENPDIAQPYWLPYFSVASIGATMKTAESLGGAVLAGPIEVPGPAWIAHLRDPQGCVVAVVGGR